MGLLILLGIAAALLAVAGSAALLHGLHSPKRKTFAVALAAGLPTDPSELELSAQPADFSLADRSSTPGWLIDGGAPDAPVVVFVHGFGDSRYGTLACWAPRVVPHASAVAVYDQRGQGESEARFAGLGVREVDDLLAVLDQLPAGPGGADRPIVLYGYSQGAGVAIAAAASAGERIVGVIADGPYRHWDEPVRGLLRGWKLPAWAFLPLVGLVLRIRYGSARRFDRVEHARRLACPLLVLHGIDDDLCRFESAREIAEAAPRGRLVAFEGGGHLDLYEIDRPRYEEALERFFSGSLSGGGRADPRVGLTEADSGM